MRQRGRPPHPDILTPREWEVVALVSEGLTNAQIADQLEITERTAKYHVSEIMGKLGLDSREEIAAWRASHEPKRWGRALLVGASATAAVAVLALVALIAIGAVRTEDGGEPGLQIHPGDVLHYTMHRESWGDSTHPQTTEYWYLVGEDFNTARGRALTYNEEGDLRQIGWTDADQRVTSSSGHEIERPAFQSVFMWEDEETIGQDILRAGKPPGPTPAPDEDPFEFAGYREIAGVTVREYARSYPSLSADPEWPFSAPGTWTDHVFISDDPFGLDFGEMRYYEDAEGLERLVLERRMISFEVIDIEDVPAGTFKFD